MHKDIWVQVFHYILLKDEDKQKTRVMSGPIHFTDFDQSMDYICNILNTERNFYDALSVRSVYNGKYNWNQTVFILSYRPHRGASRVRIVWLSP